MKTIFVVFEGDARNNNWEFIVRGVATTLDIAIGVVAQCRLISHDEFDPSNWIIEELPIDVPLTTTRISDRDGAVWIVMGAINKYDATGVDMMVD